MKSYTDIEQSKRLAEILPLESADMRYDEYISYIDGTPKVGYKKSVTDGIPCWSLAPLLGVMPKEIVYKGKIVFLEFRIWDTSLEYANDDGYILYATESYDNLIDAAFEMVCWLKENGKL